MAEKASIGEKAQKQSCVEGRLALTPHGESRRRFTASGVAVSGVLLTLASRPVLGDPVAKSPSGFVSGNQSAQGPQPVSFGRSPGYWKNHTDSWPIPTDTPFKKIFPCSTTSPYKKYTFLDLMNPQSDDVNKLGMHLAAALLNARKGWTPFLPEETIFQIFSQWQSAGRFSPVPGVYWDAAQIVVYITATQS
jgi:hypothetical protein